MASSSSIAVRGPVPPLTAEIEVFLYCDGACSPNPGPGGWAFILHHVPSGKRLEESGANPSTTNNQMEMQALVQGLRRLRRSTRVQVVTDSNYLKQGMTEWMATWKRNGWRRRTADGFEPVKNLELWQELDELVQHHAVTYQWVRGHSGHPENERCDALAVAARERLSS